MYGASAEQRISRGKRAVAIGAALSDRHNPTAYRRSSLVSRWKKPEHARGSAGLDELLERLLDRVGDEVRTHVEIADEPARRQRVDERDRGVGEEPKRDEQRHEKPKRQAHGWASAGWAVDGTPILRLQCNKPYRPMTRAGA